MVRAALLGLVCSLVLVVAAAAFEARGTIRKVDPEKRILEVFSNGQLRVVPVAANARILDREGKELTGGLQSKELKDGAEVVLTVERGTDGRPEIQGIRLGAGSPGGVGQPARPRFDTSKMKPLTELGAEEYRGQKGGLYPNGQNQRPAAHETAGLALARAVRPLDAEGRADPNGRIVLLTLGMSNTSQASQAFLRLAQNDRELNPRLTLVNGAQGGMTAAQIQDPSTPNGTRFWTTVEQRLREAGVTARQVQAVWIKQADAGPNSGFPAYARTLQAELARIVQLLPGRYPNLKLAYLSSRTYGGYATTPLNPEPYAYESAFSVRWLIEQQLEGDPALNFNPARGAVRAPWLSWGPYLWANGTTRRADGLTYAESDFMPDGTHPSFAGQAKVGEQLMKFFKTDTTTKPWFIGK